MCIMIVIVLEPSRSKIRPVPVCPGSMPVFVCNTTEGGLLWETSSAISNFIYDENLDRLSPRTLGNFTLYRDGVAVNMNTNLATAVNSTAVLTDPVQLSHDGVTLRCSENSLNVTKYYSEAVLSVGKSQLTSTFYIEWNVYSVQTFFMHEDEFFIDIKACTIMCTSVYAVDFPFFYYVNHCCLEFYIVHS